MLPASYCVFIAFAKSDIVQSIPERFEQQVQRVPHRLAVQTASHQLTYTMLNRLANRVAHAILSRRGPATGTRGTAPGPGAAHCSDPWHPQGG